MLDRYLVAAEANDIPAMICITKADLMQPNDQIIRETLQEYRKIGYSTALVSSHTGEGLEEFIQILQGKISVLVGKSGVGKTSLLNAIQPDLELRVNTVNEVTEKAGTLPPRPNCSCCPPAARSLTHRVNVSLVYGKLQRWIWPIVFPKCALI